MSRVGSTDPNWFKRSIFHTQFVRSVFDASTDSELQARLGGSVGERERDVRERGGGRVDPAEATGAEVPNPTSTDVPDGSSAIGFTSRPTSASAVVA